MRVATVFGTRPEIIRLSRVLAALDKSVDHVTVHTGQNYDYELNQIFFDDLGLRKPDYFLGAAGKSACETIGQVITRVDQALAEIKPDAMLVLGDTNSCLAAYPAKRRKIPVFHMEAGNRCFDQRVPEEVNRRIVDHIADVNMPYSTISRDYLLREGLPPDRVIKTGSPMYEVLHHYLPKIQASTVLDRLRLLPREYFVVSAHREENIDSSEQFAKLIHMLGAHPQTSRRKRGQARPQDRAVEAAGAHRLRQATDERPRRAVGQWHHHRGKLHPEFPGAQHPRGPRTPRGVRGGGGDAGRVAMEHHPGRLDLAGGPAAWRSAQLAHGRRLRRAQRQREGRAHHHELHRLRESHGLAKTLIRRPYAFCSWSTATCPARNPAPSWSAIWRPSSPARRTTCWC
jgi:hypothetical protein